MFKAHVPSPKHHLQRNYEDNIRKHLLKGKINKKDTVINKIEADYGDTGISSDENSECCNSEPETNFEDRSYNGKLGQLSNKKEAGLPDVDTDSNRTKHLGKGFVSSPSGHRDLIQSYPHPSGSLQNVHEVALGVIITGF